jgi:hypothetical protein
MLRLDHFEAKVQHHFSFKTNLIAIINPTNIPMFQQVPMQKCLSCEVGPALAAIWKKSTCQPQKYISTGLSQSAAQ